MPFHLNKLKASLAVVGLGLTLGATPAVASSSLLNSSYDIARELFASYNDLFQEHWQEKTGENVEISQSHGGSSRQAQAIIQGLRADVVTFNQVTDINILHERGNLLPEDWQQRLPNASSPYYSTMAFLVRKDNPKNIQNWDDLTREEVSGDSLTPRLQAMAAIPTWLHWVLRSRPGVMIRKPLIPS